MLNKFYKYLKQRHRLPLVGILCLFAVYISAHTIITSGGYKPMAQMPIANNPIDTTGHKKPKKAGSARLIVIKHADFGRKKQNIDYQILTGNVSFFHDGAFLYCDSAHYNDKGNTFDAFSNVKMVQGDTIFLYGDYMHYQGDTKLVKVRKNVKLENIPQNVQLYTDSLDYDREHNIGYYFNGGKLVDSTNVLTSNWGQYEPNIKMANFIDSVVLKNPNFTLYSDTLDYNTGTRISTILSQSTIVSDSGIIYSSKGWHNTDTQQSMLLDQSSVVNKSGDRTLTGDTIFYNRNSGYGEVFGHMNLIDTTKKVILRGNYGIYNDISNYAMATDSAYAIEYSQEDSLFIHADTLFFASVLRKPKPIVPDYFSEDNDSIIPPLKTLDSITTQVDDEKPIYDREIKAYYGVRFYRSDLQGVCDSMQYNSVDSTLYMFREPVLWNQGNQMTGDTIVMFMGDSTIREMQVRHNSFSIEQKDSIHFNQMKGRMLKAFFEDGKIQSILIEGNAESIFYPEEKDKSLTVHNQTESSYLQIWIKENKLDKIKLWSKATGKATPLEMLLPEQERLANFHWLDYLRPKDRWDIFRKASKKETDVQPIRSSVFDNTDDEE